MARLPFKLRPGRGAWRGGIPYLVLAVAVFAVLVLMLFRGGSPGPESTSVADPPAVEGAATGAVRLVAAPEPLEESTVAPVALPFSPVPVAEPPSPVPGPEVLNPAAPETEAVIAEAVALVRAQPGRVIAARDKLTEALQMSLTPDQRQTVKSELAKLAGDWLFGPAAFGGDPLCDTYLVRRGDVLDVIGRRFKVPYELLMQINRIPRPEALQAGQALKVVKGPFHGKIYRSEFVMDVYLQETYIRSFPVGLGKPGHETPVGLWRVREGGKLVQPTWTDPDTGHIYAASDPDYPLGSRWIGLEGVSGAAQGRTGFAIHGTKDPDQIGTAGSRGCIRMHDDDVVLVYNLFAPLYSQVEVVE
jgi:LysM repeat protein